MFHKSIITGKEFEMGNSIINNNIRRWRFNADEMTQQQLADEVGVSRQTIVAIEKGNYSPSLELAFRFAHIFKTPLEEIFSYDPGEIEPKNKK
jgi:putative transcriptional regulator